MGNGKVSSRTRDPSQEKFKRISRKINLDFPLACGIIGGYVATAPRTQFAGSRFQGQGAGTQSFMK
jgi:hypothetical protein